MNLQTILLCACLVFASAIQPASAQEISGNFQGGSVKIGPDNAPCDAERAGAVRYEADGKTLSLCDGQSWNKIAASSEIVGSPLMGRRLRYEDHAGFADYNAKMENFIAGLSHDQTIKNALRAACILPDINAPVPPAGYADSNCGRHICSIETGIEPIMTQYLGYCAHGSAASCFFGKFYLGWSCLAMTP